MSEVRHEIAFRDDKTQEAVCSCGYVMEWDWEASEDAEVAPSLARAFGRHLAFVRSGETSRVQMSRSFAEDPGAQTILADVLAWVEHEKLRPKEADPG